MKVVITGGSGLVGRALAASLADDGHRAVILSRRPEGVTGVSPGVAVEAWDGRSAEALVPLIEGADGVVHLAGENIAAGRWTETRKALIRQSRILSSDAVARAFDRAQRRPAVLLQASAVGIYGPRGDEEIDERDSAGSDFLSRVCGDWEAASDGVEALGVRRVILRTGVVLSRSGGALPRMMMPFRLFAGGPVGSGGQWLPWIHLQDEVGAIRFLLECTETTGPFNLTAPEPLANREFSRLLGRVLGRPSLLPAPGFALRLALGEMSTIVLTGQRALPVRLLEAGYAFSFPEAEGALRDLLG